MKKSNWVYWLEYAPIWVTLKLFRPLPLPQRARVIGWLLSKLILLAPSKSGRAMSNLQIAFPNMSKQERWKITTQAAYYIGQTLTELFNLDEYMASNPKMEATGAGLESMKEALTEGKGVVIVSAHLGQWQAMRWEIQKYAKSIGAVYKPNNNPYYEKIFYAAMTHDGSTLYAKGTDQVRDMIKAAANGEAIVILSDQRFRKGDLIPFFGRNAYTSTAPAGIGLKLGIPVIPVFCIRQDWGIEAEFEAPIPHGDPVEMMQQYHRMLEQRIKDYPDQWYWFHNRWDGVPKDQQLPAQDSSVDRVNG
ncbi:MAG: lysophospholipid acyltransferase family protein [Pseudomonadota bacterium]